MRNHSNENDFDLHENETACRTHGLLFVRESLVTILEHQDEARGNRDTTKAHI